MYYQRGKNKGRFISSLNLNLQAYTAATDQFIESLLDYFILSAIAFFTNFYIQMFSEMGV